MYDRIVVKSKEYYHNMKGLSLYDGWNLMQ